MATMKVLLFKQASKIYYPPTRLVLTFKKNIDYSRSVHLFTIQDISQYPRPRETIFMALMYGAIGLTILKVSIYETISGTVTSDARTPIPADERTCAEGAADMLS